MNPALKLLDDELPEEPGPDWRCSVCGAAFKTETAFKLHECDRGGV